MDKVLLLLLDRLMYPTILFTMPCNIVQFAPGYVCVSECESNSVKVTQSNNLE